MNKIFNTLYGMIHGYYWMSFAVFFSFASVYLLPRGYSNFQIGMIFAIGNALALVIQPFLSDFADKGKKMFLLSILTIMSTFVIGISSVLYFMDMKSMLMTIVYVIIIATVNMMQPLINGLSFKLIDMGYNIKFGVCRSFGSFAYAVLSSILGVLVIKVSTDILTVVGQIIFVSLIFIIYLTNRMLLKNKNDISKEHNIVTNDERIDLISFIKRHRVFFVLNIGVFLVFFSNQIANSFMLQIVEDVGGNSVNMGNIFTLLAFLEIPTLMYYDKLRKKINIKLLLKISTVCYMGQMFTYFIAPNVFTIFLAQVFQPFAFGLFLPSMIYLIDHIMDRGESIKGQSLFTMAASLSSIVSAMIGGFVIDNFGIKILLLISFSITTIGAIIIGTTLKRV